MTIMRAEIAESIAVATRLLARRNELEAVGAHLAARKPAVLVVAGRGTSDHAAIYARYLFETTLGIPVALAAASLQTQYGVNSASPRSALLALSQSGAGPDIIAVTEGARLAGALTIALTNDEGSPLFSTAEIGVGLGAGPERAVAATKTYLAELVAVALIAAGAARATRLPASWTAHLDELPAQMEAALAATNAWVAAAAAHPAWQGLLRADRALAVARGFEYPNALECALKLRETTGIFADGYSAADLLHGPIASANAATPALLIATDPTTADGVSRASARLAELGVPLLKIGSTAVPATGDGLTLPDVTPGPLGTPVGGISLLALVEAVAVARGANPDAPAGLSKVTKTL
jgi:glucosamine--fructose-6-phosphate aminotransferase (isomerizing)